MQEPDRKLAWSGIAVAAIIAIELALFLVVGPANHSGNTSADQKTNYWIWECVTSAAFWTAVFTGALTVSTYLMWLATKSAADIARRALTELERPFVVVGIPTCFTSEAIVPIYRDGQRTARALTIENATLNVSNQGRTPALLRAIHYEWIPWPTRSIPSPISPKKVAGRELPNGIIASEKKDFTEEENLRFRLDQETRINLGRDAMRLWCIGFVRYEDIFRQRYVVGFASLYDPIGRRFVTRGGNEYNYYREEKPGEIPPPEEPKGSGSSTGAPVVVAVMGDERTDEGPETNGPKS